MTTPTPTFTYPAGPSYPLTQAGHGCLQIWSGEDDPRRPDVFQLEDGRICRINQPTTASMERDCYAVQILSASRHCNSHHYRVLGNAGLMYCSRQNGMWELYPVERNVKRYQRPGQLRIIPSVAGASKRSAALALIVASDAATGTFPGYAHPARSHKVGRWHVQALPTQADCTVCPKPSKGERRANPAGVQFLVTFNPKVPVADSRDVSAVVLVRSDRHPAGGYELVAETLAVQHGNGDSVCVDVPDSVLRFCLERCRIA